MTAVLAMSVSCTQPIAGRIVSKNGPPPSSPPPADTPSSSPCIGEDCDPKIERYKFNCTPGEAPSVSPLKRLSKTEYANTIGDLLGTYFSDQESSAIVSSLQPTLNGIPAEAEHHEFDRQDSTITQQHIDAYFNSARDFSDEVTATNRRITALAGSCATAANPSTECLENFIRSFGLKAFRRPLTTEDINRYLDYYQEDATTGIRTVVFAFLMSKEFLYRLELDGDPAANTTDLYHLTGYEIAARLSYYFWSSMPDQALLDAAGLPSTDENALTNEIGYRRQVDRLYDRANPGKTKAMTSRFFQQWLDLENVPLPHTEESEDPVALRDAMIKEIEDFTDYYAWTEVGGYDELLLSTASFAQGPLAEVYKVQPWAGESQPPVQFDSTQRAGLLTRAALLSTGGQRQNAMLRGARIYRDVLCGTIEIPNPDDVDGALEPPQWTASKATRQLYEETTEGGYCAGCHTRINPLGFAFENYDALGGFQTEERLSDESGEFVHPIDANTYQSLATGEKVLTQNGVELSQHFSKTGQGAACMVISFFRYAYGREEVTIADQCVLEDLRQRLDENDGSLAAMFKGAALQPEFILRKQ